MRANESKERLRSLQEQEKRNAKLFRIAFGGIIDEMIAVNRSGRLGPSLLAVLEKIRDSGLVINNEIAEVGTPRKVLPFPTKQPGGVTKMDSEQEYNLTHYRNVLAYLEEQLQRAVNGDFNEGYGPTRDEIILRLNMMIDATKEDIRMIEYEIANPEKAVFHPVEEEEEEPKR